MSKSATLSIIGPIGNFTYQGQKICGVQLVDVVTKITTLDPEVDTLIVEIDSPGGNSTTGTAIYDMLVMIQPRLTVKMIQIGDVGSISTKIWLASPDRKAAKGVNTATGQPFQFMIHNPWLTMTSGNADSLQDDVDGLRVAEDEMAMFYAEATGLDIEMVKPLMRAESRFDADKALDLGFATSVYEANQQIAAYNMETKKKDETSLVDKTLAALGLQRKDVVAVAPPATLMGQAVMINGAAAPDGIYTVAGGMVTALADSAPAVAPPAAAPVVAQPAAAPDATSLDKLAVMIADSNKKTNEAIVALAASVDEKIVAMNKGITSGHVPVGYTPETSGDLAKEWDTTKVANQHGQIKKSNPEKYQAMFFAKFGKMPSM